MRIEEYNQDKHLVAIDEWYRKRDMDRIPRSLYPEHGVVCYTLGGLAGAMWLLRTDSPIAFLEYAILRPGIEDRDLRRACIRAMAMDLIGAAREFSHSIILASPKAQTIIDVARDLGFEHTGEHLVLGGEK